MTPLIRPVTPDDSQQWLRLRRALWPDGEDDHAAEIQAWFTGARHEHETVLIAEHQGAAIGLAELSVRAFAEGCRSPRVAYLEGWFVEPDWRRRGVGRALLAAAEDWARAQGCTEFGSDAEVGNLDSVRAHQACGFRDAGRLQCFAKRL